MQPKRHSRSVTESLKSAQYCNSRAIDEGRNWNVSYSIDMINYVLEVMTPCGLAGVR